VFELVMDAQGEQHSFWTELDDGLGGEAGAAVPKVLLDVQAPHSSLLPPTLLYVLLYYTTNTCLRRQQNCRLFELVLCTSSK
jgi:hypothetical protein